MKRLFCLLLALLFLFGAQPLALAEEETAPGFSFDLFFHMNAEEFPESLRPRIQGYADLVNTLELKGTVVWYAPKERLDLHASLIPVNDPSAAISFRIYGVPSHLFVSSPLLGDETVFLNNAGLMEFAMKTYHQFNIPLQYAVLLYPYVTRNAFDQLSGAWRELVGEPEESTEIPVETLSAVADSWSNILTADPALTIWYSGIGEAANVADVVVAEFDALPDYLLTAVAENGPLSFRKEQTEDGASSETWTAPSGRVLFTRTESENAASWTLTLPETAGGYVPSAGYSCTKKGDTADYDLYAEYLSAASGAPSLFSLSVSSEGIPTVWPHAGSFSAEITVTGLLFPDFTVQVRADAAEDGSFTLSVLKPLSAEKDNPSEILQISGTVVPMPPQEVPGFSTSWILEYINIFSVNETTLAEFVRKVAGPVLRGLLNFVDVIPASSCQVIMNDLTESGALQMLLAD